MSVFKLNRRSFAQTKRKLVNDIGKRMMEDMKEEYKLLPTYYYGCSDKVDSIVYDCSAKVVGSEDWAIAASDTGGDWKWSKEPPYERIKEWLIKHQGVSPKDRRLHVMIKNTQKKILDQGIESHYWVDIYLNHFTESQGNGSGMI